MPIHISSVGHPSVPPEEMTAETSGTTSSSVPPISTTVHDGIQQAARNFEQVAKSNVFAAETNQGETTLRFGDGVQGEKPPSGSDSEAADRSGSGKSGNQPTPDPVLWSAIRMRTKAIR